MRKIKSNIKDCRGEKHITNEGYEIEIIEFSNWENCDIKFTDGGHILRNVSYGSIRLKAIKNPYHLSAYGVGYMGIGKHKAVENYIPNKYYIHWRAMLERCYSSKKQEKCPTYKGVTVCKEWHNFQNFAEWCVEYFKENQVLDKDILLKGSKIYSPETCCFVPQEINALFTKRNILRGDLPIGVRLSNNGSKYIASISKYWMKIYIGTFDTKEKAFNAYKIEKESHIKVVTEKWKLEITPETYQALMNYQVEITD